MDPLVALAQPYRVNGDTVQHGFKDTRRVRMDLSKGAYMDVCITPDCSPETIAALKALGEAAAKQMREAPASPAVTHTGQ